MDCSSGEVHDTSAERRIRRFYTLAGETVAKESIFLLEAGGWNKAQFSVILQIQ